MADKPPDAASLYEAALNHMARYAATEMSLARALTRRVERWGKLWGENAAPEEIARAMRRAKAEIPGILHRLREQGVLNDDAFATARAKRLTRAGKSRHAAMAHLAAKGIKNPSLPDDPQRELAAACAYLRRRRAGPFGPAPTNKILAAMARGGFTQATARQAMALTLEDAEALITWLAAPLA